MKVETVDKKKIFYCGQDNDTKKENEKKEELKNVKK